MRRGYFDDLPWETRQSAWNWLSKFLRRHPHRPNWLLPILVGQARRLALNPPTPAWGRSMLARRGGYAVQRRFRAEGRKIQAYATLCRVHKRAAIKKARQPGFVRHWIGNLEGV